MPKYSVVLVPPTAVPSLWEAAKPFLEKSLEHAFGDSIDTVYAECVAGDQQLWFVGDTDVVAVFTTQIVDQGDNKELLLFQLGGSGVSLWGEEAMGCLLAFASDNGCKRLITYSRPGTEKLYKPFGLEKETVVLTRYL